MKIGDVSVTTTTAKRRELVPIGYELSSTTNAKLRWLMQKDKLKQDVFLVGPPGCGRRRLVLSYLVSGGGFDGGGANWGNGDLERCERQSRIT